MARLDQQIIAQHRRISPTGGSDSHGHYLRATTYVLVESRTEHGVHDALASGRVCIRSPEACSLRVRTPGGPWHWPGAAFITRDQLEVRTLGTPIEILRNGHTVARPESGQIVTLAAPAEQCSLVRARVGPSFSGPIYVNCTFAKP